MAVSSDVVEQLRAALGTAPVTTDPDRTAAFACDWTGRFTGTADVVVSPRTTVEVSRVMSVCAASRTPVVARGGGTGLVAGAVPETGSVVVDLRRLDAVSLDPRSRVATVGAGTPLDRLQQAARAVGLTYAVDLASRSAATVGGTIATNAGGLRVLRYGDTRAQIVGVEAVLADGSVVSHLPGVTRDNTGYHLPSVFVGSEGTLAIVTTAQLRLLPGVERRAVALLAFNDTEPALDAAWRLARHPFTSAVEMIRRSGIELVCSVSGLPAPFVGIPHTALLVEMSAPIGAQDALQEVLPTLTDLVDAAVALDTASVARLWSYRERHTESIATLGPAHKLDVTLPPDSLARFLDDVEPMIAATYPAADVWLFGHLADGNVHVNVTGVAPGNDSVDDLVLRHVRDVGGSISTEHGIGRAKRRWLHLARGQAELDLFRRIKSELDPYHLLNPGVLLPPAEC